MLKILKKTTIVVLFLVVAFFAFMGFGEMLSGDMSGVMHLFLSFPLVLFIYFLAK
jgi:hypothetical protein